MIENNASQPDPRVVTHILERDYSGGFKRDEQILIIGGSGSRSANAIIYDEAHRYDAPWKVSDLNFHHKGETPRGTTPSYIGGIKKSKQQRAAIKARRKQR